MADYTHVMNIIRTRVPGALDAAIKIELRNAVKEFLDGSDVWQQELEIEVEADEDEYTLTPTDDGLVNRFKWAYNASDIPVTGTLKMPDTFVLDVVPTQEEVFTVTIAVLSADLDASGFPEVPDWIITKYGEGIAEGTLSKLMLQPAKPYSNERFAMMHMQRFMGVIAKARMETQRSHTAGTQRWRFPQTFAVRRR